MQIKKKSLTFSSVGIQLTAKWQFCKRTQVPTCCKKLIVILIEHHIFFYTIRTKIAFSIAFSAMGPWCWPKEIASTRFCMPTAALNLKISSVGLAPEGQKQRGKGKSKCTALCSVFSLLLRNSLLRPPYLYIPGDSTKRIGVVGVDSLYFFMRSEAGGSMYSGPKCVLMKFWMASGILSARRHLYVRERGRRGRDKENACQ